MNYGWEFQQEKRIDMKISELIRNKGFFFYDKFLGRGVCKNIRDLNNYYFSQESKEIKQKKMLASFLKHACLTTDYYQKYSAKTLSEYPVLTKKDIRLNYKSILSKKYNKNELIEVKTSGSYGTPLSFWLTQYKKSRQLAEVIYFGRWAGYDVGVKHIYSRSIAFKSKLKEWLQNEVYIPCEKLDDVFLGKTLEELLKKQHKVFIAFPSAAALVAEYALSKKYRPEDFDLKGIITCSENLTESQRALMKKAFNCPVMSRYSTEETGVLANECEEGLGFHINSASYIVEVLDLNEDKPVKEGDIGRIVVTDLFSHAMPLIRYEIGDLGRVVSDKSCGCGRKTPMLVEFSGRTMQVIEDTNGNKLYPTALSILMEEYPFIIQYQFIQESKHEYTFNLVFNEVSDKLLLKLEQTLKSWVGSDAIITINKVSEIKKLPSGKRPYIINKYKE